MAWLKKNRFAVAFQLCCAKLLESLLNGFVLLNCAHVLFSVAVEWLKRCCHPLLDGVFAKAGISGFMELCGNWAMILSRVRLRERERDRTHAHVISK